MFQRPLVFLVGLMNELFSCMKPVFKEWEWCCFSNMQISTESYKTHRETRPNQRRKISLQKPTLRKQKYKITWKFRIIIIYICTISSRIWCINKIRISTDIENFKRTKEILKQSTVIAIKYIIRDVQQQNCSSRKKN